MRRKQYHWTLPDKIDRRLGESTYGRQRAIYEDEHLLLILHTPPGADDASRQSVVFLRRPDGRWMCNGAEEGQRKLHKLLKGYQDIYSDLDARYEKSTSAADLFEILEPLAPVARAATNMKAALQSARELVKDDAFLIEMRDAAYESARNFELLLSDAKIALDFRIAQNAERQSVQVRKMAVAQHKLNLLAAITFPLMAGAALFGMNMVHGLENKSPQLFWAVLAVGVVIGVVTQKWVTKSRR